MPEQSWARWDFARGQVDDGPLTRKYLKRLSLHLAVGVLDIVNLINYLVNLKVLDSTTPISNSKAVSIALHLVIELTAQTPASEQISHTPRDLATHSIFITAEPAVSMTTQTPLAFREATPEDVPLLLPLIRTAYRGTEGWTTEAAYLNDKRISDTDLLAKINRPNGIVFIVTHAETGDLIACCEVELQASSDAADPTAYFGLFAVDPARQGGGIGKQVLARAEAFARERWQAKRMEMFVIWLRSELIDYYVRRGYQRTDETKPFPYAEVVEGRALRDDLYFTVLRKDITTAAA